MGRLVAGKHTHSQDHIRTVASVRGVNVEEDEAAATLKALQEYSSSKRDRKNKPQYKMFMKLFRC